MRRTQSKLRIPPDGVVQSIGAKVGAIQVSRSVLQYDRHCYESSLKATRSLQDRPLKVKTFNWLGAAWTWDSDDLVMLESPPATPLGRRILNDLICEASILDSSKEMMLETDLRVVP